jgi:hypothetical protein
VAGFLHRPRVSRPDRAFDRTGIRPARCLVAPAKFPYAKLTRGLIDGPRNRPRLGESGQKLIDLLTWDPASRPEPQPQRGLSGDAANRKLPTSDE